MRTPTDMRQESTSGGATGIAVRLTPVLGYVRVTTEGQLKKADLARQVERLQLYAQRHGFEIVRIYEEQSHGALSSRQDRPKLHQCLASAKKRGCKILVTSPSRLSRNSEHARQLDAEYPEGFIFAEPLAGYETRPWPVEVKEVHEAFPGLTQTGTQLGMDRARRQGKKLGAGDGGVAGRIAAAKAKSTLKRSRIERMADVLAKDPDWRSLTRQEAADFLNKRGHRSPRSTSRSPTLWSKKSITEHLKAARKFLHARASSNACPHESRGPERGHAVSVSASRSSERPSGTFEREAEDRDASAGSMARATAASKSASAQEGVF